MRNGVFYDLVIDPRGMGWNFRNVERCRVEASLDKHVHMDHKIVDELLKMDLNV